MKTLRKALLASIPLLIVSAIAWAVGSTMLYTPTGSELTTGQIPKASSTADGKFQASACTDNATTVICTLPMQAPALMTVSSGAIGPTGNVNIVECSTTCTVTFIAPVAGSMQCVRNEAAVTTVITVAAITAVSFEKTDNSAYGTSGTGTMVSTNGEVSSKVCLVGRDTTHYDVFSFKGTWTNS